MENFCKLFYHDCINYFDIFVKFKNPRQREKI